MAGKSVSKRALSALALALVLTVALLASVAVMWLEIGHRCGGQDCATCEGILSLQALLSHFAVLLAVVLARGRAAMPARRAAGTLRWARSHATLITLRTRMNN